MDWDDWNKLSSAKKQEWINANERPLTLLLQAGKRADCAFFDVPYDDRTFRDRIYRLFALLERSAAQLEFSAKLGEAWERYVAALRLAHHLRQGTGSWIWDTANYNEGDVYGRLPKWAAQPGQSRERLVAAIKQLDELEASRPWSSDAIKSDYLRLRRIVTGGPDAIASSGIEGATTSEAITWSLLPWERRRALRLLNYRTESELELSLLYDWRTDDPPVDDMTRLLYRDPRAGGEYGETQIRLLRTTFVLSPFYHLMNGASLAMSSCKSKLAAARRTLFWHSKPGSWTIAGNCRRRSTNWLGRISFEYRTTHSLAFRFGMYATACLPRRRCAAWQRCLAELRSAPKAVRLDRRRKGSNQFSATTARLVRDRCAADSTRCLDRRLPWRAALAKSRERIRSLALRAVVRDSVSW